MDKDNQKTLVPKLRFPEFQDAGEWEETRLGNIVDVLQGFGFPEKYQGKKNGKYPFYKVSDISNALASGSHFIEKSANYIDDDDLLYLKAKTIPRYTTIFAKIGEAIRSNRRAITSKECVIDNNTAGVKAKEGKAKDLFAFYLFSKVNLIDHSGGVVPSVNKTTMENISITCPQLPEQQKIADCLSSIDGLITAQGRKIESLKAHKKGLMQQLFPAEGETIPKLRFPEFQDAGEWEGKPLEKICKVNPPTSDLPDKFIYIDLESVVSGEVILKKEISKNNAPSRAQRLLKNGDVIYQMVRPYQKNNFFFNIDDGNDYVASTGYAQLRAYSINTFLFQLIHTDVFVKQVLSKCTGSNYPAIRASDLANVKTAVPESYEQQQIADCLSSIDDLITAHSQKHDALKAHKKGLMQQLFPAEGETVPKRRFPEFRDAEEWDKKPLGNNCSSISSGKDKSDINGTYDLYGSTGVIGKTSSDTFAGDFILAARVGANAGLLTRASGKFGVTDNTLVIFLKKTEKIDFIYYSLDRIGLNKMVFGSGQPLITGKQLKDLVINLPDPEEQQKIADCLSSIDELITAHTQKHDALKAHKKGLMQQLFPAAGEVGK